LIEITLLIGYAIAILHGIAYVMYNIQAKLEESSPNPASWFVWAYLAVLNALSYREMSNDWVTTLQFYTGSVMCILTVLYVLAIGKFAWPEWQQWGQLVIGLFALVWWQKHDAGQANMIVLCAFLLSSWFTVKGVYDDPAKETPTAWVIWTLAFVLSILNLWLRSGKALAYVTPLALLVIHGSVAYLSRAARKKQFGLKEARHADTAHH